MDFGYFIVIYVKNFSIYRKDKNGTTNVCFFHPLSLIINMSPYLLSPSLLSAKAFESKLHTS